MKIKQIIVALALSLIQVAAFSQMTPAKSFVPAKAKGTTRLVSYNVGIFNKYAKDDFALIAAMMHEVEADVIGLNEVDNQTTRTGKIDQAKRFAEELGGWDYIYGAAMPYRGGEYGSAMVSKVDAVRKYEHKLPQHGGKEPRVLVVMEFKNYVVATAHLDLVEAAQMEQVRFITKTMMEEYGKSKKPVFLGGDFNNYPDSAPLAEFAKSWSVISTTDEFTFPSTGPSGCIDYFLALNNGAKYKVLHAQVMGEFNSGDVKVASDHLPIMVDVKIK